MKLLLVPLFAMAVTIHGGDSLAQGKGQGPQGHRMFGKGAPFTVEDLPPGQVRSTMESLSPQAHKNAMNWLHSFSFSEQDLGSIRIDKSGGVLYADENLPEPMTGDEAEEAAATADGPSITEITATRAFTLHSRPGAARVVYVNFQGHVIEGTAWNSSFGTSSWSAKPYDTDGNTADFSPTELGNIAEIWSRIAEDFAPFDIDVTTELPASFGPQTGHILITASYDQSGKELPYGSQAGGVAYVGVWGASYYTYYQPALVYYDNLGSGWPPYVTEAASHELGHNLALSHDGTSTAGYYTGHGAGFVSWAPIMGVGYYRQVTQWSKGEYSGANNTQDDLAIIAGRLSYRPDDHENADLNNATALAVNSAGEIIVTNPETDPDNLNAANKGVIGNRNDIDLFSFDAGDAGQVNLTVTPGWAAYQRDLRRGANLDIQATLYDSAGGVVAWNDPLDETDATITANISAGRYYVEVFGVGNAVTPYSDYGSLGHYYISGTVPVVVPDTAAPTPNPMTWAVPPATTGTESITMTATAATDDSGKAVQYQFVCASGNCASSAWQGSATHTVAGLNPATTYSYQVRARDAAGNQTVLSAVASATTDSPNTAPVANDDGATVVEGNSVVINVLANDTDANGDSLTVTSVSQGSNGSVTTNGTTVTYTPNAGFSGADSFTYSIGDGRGGAATALVAVTVTPGESLPLAPSNVSADDGGSGNVMVSWSDNSANEDGFEVQRQIYHSKRGVWNRTKIVATTGTDVQSYVDTIRRNGSYRYRVRSANGAGASAWSAWTQVGMNSIIKGNTKTACKGPNC